MEQIFCPCLDSRICEPDRKKAIEKLRIEFEKNSKKSGIIK